MAIPKDVPDPHIWNALGEDIVALPDNEEMKRAVRDADHSPDAALRRLELLAAYIRSGKPVPYLLSGPFLRAVEKAGKVHKKEPELRARVFTQQLGLSAKARPAKRSYIDVGEWIWQQIFNGKSQTQSVEAAAEHFEISPTTARTYLRHFEEDCGYTAQQFRDSPWYDELSKDVK